MKKQLHILSIITAALLCSCNNSYNNPVPSYPVNLDINIAAEYPHFVPANIMQHMTFTKPRLVTDRIGYGGVLVLTGLDAQYHAFDLSCPVEARRDIRVYIDGMYAVCPQCGEQYEVFYGIGNPTKGISRDPMRRYTCIIGNGTLKIRN